MGYILEVSILGKFFKMYTFLPPLYSRYYHFDILPSAFFFFVFEKPVDRFGGHELSTYWYHPMLGMGSRK